MSIPVIVQNLVKRGFHVMAVSEYKGRHLVLVQHENDKVMMRYVIWQTTNGIDTHSGIYNDDIQIAYSEFAKRICDHAAVSHLAA